MLGKGPACSSILDDPLLGSRAAGQGAVIIGVSCTGRCVPVQSAAHLSNSCVPTQLAVAICKYIKTLPIYLACLDSIKAISESRFIPVAVASSSESWLMSWKLCEMSLLQPLPVFARGRGGWGNPRKTSFIIFDVVHSAHCDQLSQL
jgi:hypothetical protein